MQHMAYWLLGGEDPTPLQQDGVWVLKSWKHLQHPPREDAGLRGPIALFLLMVLLAFVLPLLGWSAPPAQNVTYVEIPVLKSNVRLGEIIDADDLTTRQMIAERLNPRILKQADEIIGLELHRNVRPGMPLYVDYVRIPPTVRKNSRVELIFQAPGLAVVGQGKALEDGLTGDLIKVQNIDSGRTLMGETRADGKVVVQ